MLDISSVELWERKTAVFVTEFKTWEFIPHSIWEFLREIVKNAKSEVSAKFEEVRNRVNSLESDIFRDLDNFYDHYEKLITRRSKNISQLEIAKMRLYTSLKQNALIPALEKIS